MQGRHMSQVMATFSMKQINVIMRQQTRRILRGRMGNGVEDVSIHALMQGWEVAGVEKKRRRWGWGTSK